MPPHSELEFSLRGILNGRVHFEIKHLELLIGALDYNVSVQVYLSPAASSIVPSPETTRTCVYFVSRIQGLARLHFGFGQTTSRKTISIHMPGWTHRHQQYPLTRIESPQRLSAL